MANTPLDDAAFWQERENEFRKLGTDENKSLEAEWYSESDTWRFRGHGEQSFTYLAEISAVRLTGPKADGTCKAWLDAMRHAGSGFTVTSEGRGKWLEPSTTWDTFTGSDVSIEVQELPADDCATSNRYRYRPIEITGKIQNVFKASADYCLGLRARSQKVSPSQEIIRTLAHSDTSVNGNVGNGADHGAPKAEGTAPPITAPSARSATTWRQKNDELQSIRHLVKLMRKEGCSHREMCERLGNHPRPPQSSWRELPWPVAYRKHTNSVKKWLSSTGKD